MALQLLQDLWQQAVPRTSLRTGLAAYRAIFLRTVDAILLADEAGRIVDANPAAEQLTGYSHDELLRLQLVDLAYDPARLDAGALWRAFLDTGVQSGGFELRRKDGARCHLQYRALASIVPGLHMSVLRDVTSQETASTALRLSESLFEAVFERSPITLQVLGSDGRSLRANRAWERLWGVDRSVLDGYNIFEDRQLAAAGVLPRVRRAFAGETVILPAISYAPPESGRPGRPRWVVATLVPVLGRGGSISEVVLALEDVTQRRESETRAAIQYGVSRILADSSDIDRAAPLLVRAIAQALDWDFGALWLHEANDGVLRCVSAWSAPLPTLDLREGERLRRGNGLPGRVLETGAAEWVEDLATLSPVLHAESVVAARLRTSVCVPVKIDSAVLGAMEFCSQTPCPRDQRLEDTLCGVGSQVGQYIERCLAERAERASAAAVSRLKDEFLAVLSHELRTPLNAVLGWTHLLRAGHLDEDGRARALEVIERNVQTQSQIVEDVLDVSRIITGQLRLDVQVVDLVRVVASVVESMYPAAEAKGISLRTTFAATAPVKGDASRLRQIVWNLLSNAIKFTGPGGDVTAVVQVTPVAVELWVGDTGVGIASDVLPRVFERFLQADSSTARQHGGLGLGLAIVRHLAELHGGTATAESEGEGRGATFCLRLPSAASETREGP